MAQTCPLCNAAVQPEQIRCTDCGAELDPYRTMLPPAPRAATPPSAPARPVRPSAPSAPLPDPEHPSTVRPAPRAEPPPAAAAPPRPAKVKRPRPAPAPAPPADPSRSREPVDGQVILGGSISSSRPAPAPSPPPPYAYPQPGPPAAPAPPAGAPGGVRGWVIRKLGGQVPASEAAAPAAPGPYQPAPPPGYAPGYPSSGAPLGGVSADAWAAPGYGSIASPPAGPHLAGGVPMPPTPYSAPAYPSSAPSGLEGDDDEDAKTRYMPGADLGKLKFPTSVFTLQLLDHSGQWRSWAPIGPNGLHLGRGQNSAHFPFLSSMAVRHIRFGFERGQLVAEDLGSVNGTYRKLTRPAELSDGSRFRVGGQVIEFRSAAPLDPAAPFRSEEGEEFLSFDMEPLAFLDLIRPDRSAGLRFPITKREPTRIGRDGRQVDIALPRADFVSGQHAMIRYEGDRFLLEDMNSRNGTFLQIREPTPLSPGDVLLVGRAFLRVVDKP